MTYSINAPIVYSGANSLSPDACVLSPRGSACFLDLLVDGPKPVDNSAAASALPTSTASCNAFGEIGEWGR